MAVQVDNEKCFLVIRMSYKEYAALSDTFGFCDLCKAQPDYGYYIPLLDTYYCENCYKLWLSSAVNYRIDRKDEQKRFDKVKAKLEEWGAWNIIK